MSARDVHNELASGFGEVSRDLSYEHRWGVRRGLKQTSLPLRWKLSINNEEL